MAGIIKNVDKKSRQYLVQRFNDNVQELYYYHQIVQAYRKEIHSVNIEEHKQKMQEQKNNGGSKSNSPSSTKGKGRPPKKKGKGRGRGRGKKRKKADKEDENDDNHLDPPNKRRKLNNNTVDKLNTNTNTNSSSDSHESEKRVIDYNAVTIAQPYFPTPHPYFRQNALIKWKGKDYRKEEAKRNAMDNKDNATTEHTAIDWDVGRVVDFDEEKDIIYVQNTYRCGTEDDWHEDLLVIDNWTEWQKMTDAIFIKHNHLYQLHQPILYWWDRPGCGSICEDTIEGLDYGAENNLIYGITGGTKQAKKRKSNPKYKWSEGELKWCHSDGIIPPSLQNKRVYNKYIARNHKQVKSKTSLSTTDRKKLYDCIIVGGGMAGLTCRWALDKIDNEYNTMLLEAQDYLGGRLRNWEFPEKTVYDPNGDERYDVPAAKVELGAAFLSGSGKDNRFWNWLKKNDRNVCADWGGYNNAWWNEESFVDSNSGKFVDGKLVEKIKSICDCVSVLSCKLVMPLKDMAVIDALDYLRYQIPKKQLFTDDDPEMNKQMEQWFYLIFDKYKILSANWVGPQGLWQQQQTVQIMNLDLEELYLLLKHIYDDRKRGKKWTNAIEKLIGDYYGDRQCIETENSEWNNKTFTNYSYQDVIIAKYENEAKMNGSNGEIKPETETKDVKMGDKMENDDVDSEATESENGDGLKKEKEEEPIDFKKALSHVDWNDVVRYDINNYNAGVYQYKFGYKDILIRDIVTPPSIEQSQSLNEMKETTGLSDTDWDRLRRGLNHIGECNVFSYRLYTLANDITWKGDPRVKALLDKFKEDLETFEDFVDDFKILLAGKTLNEQKREQQTYHNKKAPSVSPMKDRTLTPKNETEPEKEEIENEQDKDIKIKDKDTENEKNDIDIEILNGEEAEKVKEKAKEKEEEEIYELQPVSKKGKRVKLNDIGYGKKTPPPTKTSGDKPIINGHANNASNGDVVSLVAALNGSNSNTNGDLKMNGNGNGDKDNDDENKSVTSVSTETSSTSTNSIPVKRRTRNHRNKKPKPEHEDKDNNNHSKKKSKKNSKKSKKGRKPKKSEQEKQEKQGKQDEAEYKRIDREADRSFVQKKFNACLNLDPKAIDVGDGFVTKGYSQVLEPFITDIHTDINNKPKPDDQVKLNHQVTSIARIKLDQAANLRGAPPEEVCEVRGIDIETGKPFLMWSRFVAVSVPLGILKLSLRETKSLEAEHSGILFKPPLSNEKRDAIQSMGMGCENKVYLRFTKCFWNREKPYFQSIQHPEYRFINLAYRDFKLDVNTNVLCTMIPPTMGRKWYPENPAQQLRVVWDVLRVLNQMFKVRLNDEKEMNGEMKRENTGQPQPLSALFDTVRNIENPSFNKFQENNDNVKPEPMNEDNSNSEKDKNIEHKDNDNDIEMKDGEDKQKEEASQAMNGLNGSKSMTNGVLDTPDTPDMPENTNSSTATAIPPVPPLIPLTTPTTPNPLTEKKVDQEPSDTIPIPMPSPNASPTDGGKDDQDIGKPIPMKSSRDKPVINGNGHNHNHVSKPNGSNVVNLSINDHVTETEKDNKEEKKQEDNQIDDSRIMRSHTPIINGMNGHNYNNKMDEDSDDEGKQDKDYEIQDDGQRICKIKEDKDDIGALLRLLVDYKVTDWEHNVFTRGSYSYLPKGALYNHCKALQEYDGNGVYFCGEATSVSGFECVDGAHETGFDVAKEIHKGLQKAKYKYSKFENQRNRRR